MPAPFTVSFGLDAKSAELLAHVAESLVSDLIVLLLENPSVCVFTSADGFVHGTQNSIVRLRFDPIPLDKQVRAALRAAGYELPDRDDVVGHASSSVGWVAPSTVGGGGRVSNDPAPSAAA